MSLSQASVRRGLYLAGLIDNLASFILLGPRHIVSISRSHQNSITSCSSSPRNRAMQALILCPKIRARQDVARKGANNSIVIRLENRNSPRFDGFETHRVARLVDELQFADFPIRSEPLAWIRGVAWTGKTRNTTAVSVTD